LREYCPRAFGTWAIFPKLREISLTIDLDASHYLHIIAAADAADDDNDDKRPRNAVW